jgi:hypothetical protein
MPPFKHNLRSGELNESAGHGGDFRLLADSVRAHENAHSSLAKTALYKLEPFPTKELEPLTKATLEELTTFADMVVRGADTALGEASSEENVRAELEAGWGNKSATVLIRDDGGGFVERTYASLANNGG